MVCFSNGFLMNVENKECGNVSFVLFLMLKSFQEWILIAKLIIFLLSCFPAYFCSIWNALT